MKIFIVSLFACSSSLCACVPTSIHVQPLVVEPIQMNIDVTIVSDPGAAKPGVEPADNKK